MQRLCSAVFGFSPLFLYTLHFSLGHYMTIMNSNPLSLLWTGTSSFPLLKFQHPEVLQWAPAEQSQPNGDLLRMVQAHCNFSYMVSTNGRERATTRQGYRCKSRCLSPCFSPLRYKAWQSGLNNSTKLCIWPLPGLCFAKKVNSSITCFAVSSLARVSSLAISMVQATFRRLLTLKQSSIRWPAHCLSRLHSTFSLPSNCTCFRTLPCKEAAVPCT